MLKRYNLQGGEMMINRKGLSTVVTTLIIVLLVLAAIGLIWGPIRNLLTSSTNSLDQTRCLSVDISAKRVVYANSLNESYNVTLARVGGDGIFEAKLTFFDAQGNTDGAHDAVIGTTIAEFSPADTKTVGPINATANATKVEVIPTYTDADGKQQICTTKSTYEFTLP